MAAHGFPDQESRSSDDCRSGAGGRLWLAVRRSRAQPCRLCASQYHRPAQIPYPKDDPYSDGKAKLGRVLFFDPLLSGSKLHSCASCHNPGLSWGDGEPQAVGEKHLPLRAPTLLNVAWTPKLGWDGHFRDLESVAIGPLSSPDNMNLPVGDLIARLSVIPDYVASFNATYGKGDITQQKIEQALATFQRSIVSNEAPFDRWIGGDPKAISESAKRAASSCSTPRPIARPVIAAGRSRIPRSMMSASRRTTIPAAASCSRLR